MKLYGTINMNGKLVTGLPDYDKIFSMRYTIYTVPQTFAGKPYLIANEFYGNVSYMKILMIYNNVLEPSGWPNVGDVIRIPNQEEVIGLF